MPQDVEFFMPYSRRTADGLSAGMERHLRWAADMGFMPSEAAADRYRFSQHAEVGAWFCPEPGQDRDLDLQLDVNGWYFMIDDAFDVPEGRTADGAVAVCQQLMELLAASPEDAPAGPGTSPLVTAFADIWQRERQGMSAFWRQRAGRTWTGYLAGNLAEEANRRVSAALTPAEYMRVRRQSVGVLPAYDMRECIGPCEVPALAWYSTHLAAMRRLSVEHVIMVNDVCSLEKDEARNETNLVTLLASQHGLSRDAAISRVVGMANSLMRKFQELEADIPSLCSRLTHDDSEHAAVHRHLVSMHDMMSGNYHWSRACGRYSREAAAMLGPDRPSLLGLHDLTLQDRHVVILRSVTGLEDSAAGDSAAGDSAAKWADLDTSRPNIARVYDYWLGGKENFEADRKEAERLMQIYPSLPRLAWENRQFVGRAVRWLVTDCGIRQFLDIGSGLPTASNTHDAAQAAAPDSRVAYVDKDPVVVMHADALLADGRNVIAARGDAANPAAILADARVSTLLQPGRPYAVILAAVLHFFPLAQARRIISEFARLAGPGSYLIVSIGSSGRTLAREYTASTLHDHSPDDIQTLLAGLEIVDPPGLVDALYWAPGTRPPRVAARSDGQILAAVAKTPG